MLLIDDPWRYTTSVSARYVIKLQLVNIYFFLIDPFYTIRLHLASTLAHKQFQVQHFLFHSVVNAADSLRPPRLLSFERVSSEILCYLMHFSLRIVLSA